MTNQETSITTQEAFDNIRKLGREFLVALINVTGKGVEGNNDLINGIAAYQILKIKGEWDHMDKSFDIVMRIAYELLRDNLDAVVSKGNKHVH